MVFYYFRVINKVVSQNFRLSQLIQENNCELLFVSLLRVRSPRVLDVTEKFHTGTHTDIATLTLRTKKLLTTISNKRFPRLLTYVFTTEFDGVRSWPVRSSQVPTVFGLQFTQSDLCLHGLVFIKRNHFHDVISTQIQIGIDCAGLNSKIFAYATLCTQNSSR